MGAEKEKNTEKNTKSSARVYIIFVAIMLVCLGVGFLTGTGVARYKDELSALDMTAAARYAANVLPILFAITQGAICAFGIFSYRSIRRNADAWDGESEDEIYDIEIRISKASILSVIGMMLSFIMFPLCVAADEASELTGMWRANVSTLVLILTLVWFACMQDLLVKLEKKLNPEKRGNALDLKFRRDWEESSDEGERILEGKAARKAFAAGIRTCMALWVVCFVCMLAFDTGVLPVIAVSVIMSVMYIVYGRALIKLQR